MATVCFLATAGAAHAKPSFVLTESNARVGDVVRFSLSGADGLAYKVDLDGTRVASGTASGVVTGAFTVPDLGGQAWTVPVGASVRDSGDWNRLAAAFDYLGRALPPPPQPASQPPPKAGPVVPDASSPAPAAVTAPSAVQRTPAPAGTSRPARSRQQSAKRHARPTRSKPAHRKKDARRHAARGHHRRTRHDRAGKRRAKRSHHRRVWPLGSLEAGRRVPGGASEPAAPAPAAPHTAIVASHQSPRGTSATALAVPGLLALAGLGLAATTVLRRRKLASLRPRD